MSDPAPAAKKSQPNINQLLIDLGPIAVFVVTYNVLNRLRPHDAIFIATGVFIVATLAAIAYCWTRSRYVPPVLIVTGVLVAGFGGLTIALHNETFMKAKPTFLYGFYAAAIFGSVLVGRNVWKLLFQHIFTLPDRIWTVLALRWGVLFIALAVLNEYIRRTQSTDFWVNSRILVFFPAILVFALLNAPLTLKHAQEPGEAPAEPPTGG
jgi:intracellular septation protein